MFSGLFKAIRQLDDPNIQRVIILAVLLSAVIFAVLVFVAGWLLAALAVSGISFIDWGIAFLGSAAALCAGIFIYPAIAGLMLSFVLNPVVQSVEARHYPYLPKPRKESVREILAHGVRYLVAAVFLNLAALVFVLPVMLATVFLAPLIPFVFYAINGYLLGREYFEIVSFRRLDPHVARAFRKRHKFRIFMCGIVIAMLMTLPLVGWLMPVIAVAFMVHVFEDIQTSDNK